MTYKISAPYIPFPLEVLNITPNPPSSFEKPLRIGALMICWLRAEVEREKNLGSMCKSSYNLKLQTVEKVDELVDTFRGRR